MLQSNSCDYSDANNVVTGTITVTRANSRDRKSMPLAFKNNALLISCISKINNVLIDNAEDLDVIMPMYNLIEYSKNYRKTTGSLCNYYRDDFCDDTNDNNKPNKNVIKSESFKYKKCIIGITYILVKKLPTEKVMKLIILLMMHIKSAQKNLKSSYH